MWMLKWLSFIGICALSERIMKDFFTARKGTECSSPALMEKSVSNSVMGSLAVLATDVYTGRTDRDPG